jgi:hypothetical protein
VLSNGAPSFVGAAELPASWTLLPDETVLIVRLPGGTAFVDALRAQTKLGAKILGKDRLQKLVDLIGQEDTAARDELTKALARLDLKSDDLGTLFAGEIGYAVVAEPRGDNEPLAVGLAWLEPKGDLAERMVKAIQTLVDDEKGGEHPVRRVDFELAGHAVMHLSFPYFEADPVHFDLGGAQFQPGQQLTPEQIQQFQQAQENAKQHEVGRTNLFVARLGNRVLLANTMAESHRDLLGDDLDHPKAVDWDEVTGVETAKGIFARFLTAHTASAGGATPRMLDTPGLSDALPDGVVLLEVLADPRPLLKMAERADAAGRVVEALGVDALGPIAYRMALDGTLMRSALFVSAPSPRRGLLRLMDQAALPAELPEWAPANVLQVEQISFDLAKLFDQIKEIAITYAGDTAQQVLAQIDQQLNALLQTDLRSLLASLGTTHTILSFPPKAAAAPQANPWAIEARFGLVWKLKDEALWKRLVQFVGNFAQQAGFAEPAEEQGFSGIRIKQQIEGGAFVGRGYLIIGFGAEVCESVMAAIRNPPSGGSALRTSLLYARANELVRHAPSLSYNLADAGSGLKGIRRMFMMILEPQNMMPPILPGGVAARTPEQLAVIEKIKALLPTEDELEGAAGVSVSQTIVNDKGLFNQSVLELPAP